MKVEIKYPMMVACTFLWIGFVSGITFLEEPLILQAASIRPSLELGVAKLVHYSLNKVEWVFATLMILPFLFKQIKFVSFEMVLFLITLSLLMLQTIWFLPVLGKRSVLYFNDYLISESWDHILYISSEIAKVGCLFIIGIKQFTPIIKAVARCSKSVLTQTLPASP